MFCFVFRELKSSGTSSGGVGGHKSFKDYEKKTCDVWDVDDDLTDYNQQLDSPNLISITDSEEMARRVIKNHQDNQERQHKPPRADSPAKTAVLNHSHSPSIQPSKLPTFRLFAASLSSCPIAISASNHF